MDSDMYLNVCCTRSVLKVVLMGLYVQHGCECRCWNCAELDVELVQYTEVYQIEAILGDLAGHRCGVAISCHELRIA